MTKVETIGCSGHGDGRGTDDTGEACRDGRGESSNVMMVISLSFVELTRCNVTTVRMKAVRR